MKKTALLILLSTAFLTQGCGKLSTQRAVTKIVKGTPGIEDPGARNLNPTELTLLASACSSLKTNRETLETKAGAIVYKKTQNKFDCSQKKISSLSFLANIQLEDQILKYKSADIVDEFEDVITDESPALADICLKTLATTTPTALKISNTVANADKLYRVTVTAGTNSLTGLKIITRQLDSKGSFVVIFTEQIQISTDGIERQRDRFTACNANQFKTQQEVYVSKYTPSND